MENVIRNNSNLAFADEKKFETDSGDPFFVFKHDESEMTFDEAL